MLTHARALAGKPPVLIIDQLDDVLREPKRRDEVLARLGPMMAATAEPIPGSRDPLCHWVLCYRHEFHGEVVEWLQDVLVQARRLNRAGVDTLAYDLTGQDRLDSWPIPLMGVELPGETGPDRSRAAFLDAIQWPLTLTTADGRARFPIRFPGDGAERLAAAFARQRALQSAAPLVPELQVVLSHLITHAPVVEGERVVEVPADAAALDALIGDALEIHLRDALDKAFPPGAHGARQNRSYALLALARLADAEGRRGATAARGDLIRAMGPEGKRVLNVLTSPSVRIVVAERDADELRYALSHDQMAQAVTRIVQEERTRGVVDFDPLVLALRRFVERRSELFAAKDPGALQLTRAQSRGIAQSSHAVLQDEAQRAWWRAAVDQRRKRTKQVAALAAVFVLAAGVASAYGLRVRRDRVRTEVCGDSRFRADAWCLPDEPLLGFVKIEAGGFLMGSDFTKDKQAQPNEKWSEQVSPGTLMLGEYYIGRYEVTRGEFRSFAEANKDIKDSEINLEQPRNWPVAEVSWDDALEFCKWLEQRLGASSSLPPELRDRLNRGWHVTLPSEAEWEKAVRGTDGRIYPWGNDWNESLANVSSALRPVGSFQCPACANGLSDGAGNVWEWTRSLGSPYPYEPGPIRENLKASNNIRRVVRGGSFDCDRGGVRAAYRGGGSPVGRVSGVGFRVVVSPFNSGL
jgi:formylglycine-generating enzyme required for sulfatase activity